MTANRESVVGVLWQRVNRFAVLFVGLLATIKFAG